MIPPPGGSSADITTPENIALAASLTAGDVDGPALAWSIAGGADAALVPDRRRERRAVVRDGAGFRASGRPRSRQQLRRHGARLGRQRSPTIRPSPIAVTDVSEVPPVTVLTGTPGDDRFRGAARQRADRRLGPATTASRSASAWSMPRSVSSTMPSLVDFGSSHTVLTGVERFRVHRRRGGQQ